MGQFHALAIKFMPKSFFEVGIFCLALLVFGCGGGDNNNNNNGSSGTGATAVNVDETAKAVRSQVESRCPANSESDFCVRVYAIIDLWDAGEITDEEFVGRIVELQEEPDSPSAGDQEGDQAEETPEPITVDVEERCRWYLDVSSGGEAYDPTWESQVNAEERKLYTGTGTANFKPLGASNWTIVVENIRIYSYDPDGQSRENTERVLGKLMCYLAHDPDFHRVTLVHGQRDEDGRQVATLGVTGTPQGNVLLFFAEDEVSSLLDRYDGMTYSEIRQDIIINQDYDWLGHSRIPNDAEITSFSAITGFYIGDCGSLRRSRLQEGGCLPNSSLGGGTYVTSNAYYKDWLEIWNDNRQ